MAETILNLAVIIIMIAIGLGIYRLVKGPTVVDRVIALDLLTLIAIALIAMIAHITSRFIYVDVALVYGLLSFLSVLAVARYLERGL
jgi:multicomponent Na+:H+ antiporter subunit F